MQSANATLGMPATSDHNVAETALDAAKCKLSAAALGYFRDDFLRLAVAKPSRRIPLIHRGYFLRHVAVSHHVEVFLTQSEDAPVNIVSLGAGFDTLFFRLVQAQKARVRFFEVDCAPIVDPKVAMLRGQRDGFFPTPASVLQEKIGEDGIAYRCKVAVSPNQDALASTYALLTCDLGDTTALEKKLETSGIDWTLPTLVLAECVVSYLDPNRGTRLLKWLSSRFPTATAVLYDPISLNDAFGATLQRYFSVKGCELRSLRTFQTAHDHARRFLTLSGWSSCAITDMNDVYAHLTSAEDKQKLSTLEPFDEFADWWLCNAHYAMFVATNAQGFDDIYCHVASSRNAYYAAAYPSRSLSNNAPFIVRTFQSQDVARVQELFRTTHLEFGKTSKAVRKFVEKRLQPPNGDLVDVARSFKGPASGFWVAEIDGVVVGCVGVKPLATIEESEVGRNAELCRLGVDESARRRGVASALISTLEAFVKHSKGAMGYQKISLETIGAMEAAQHLYRAHGYSQTAISTFSSFTLVRFEKVLS